MTADVALHRYDGDVPGRRSDPRVGKAFGRALKMARVDAEMTRHELAQAVGLQRPDDIGRFERGDREPLLSTFFAIADVLKVSPEALVAATRERLGRPERASMEEEPGR